jgi:hypothetical protein
VTFFEDIPLALTAGTHGLAGEWRTHFHVPIFAAHMGCLGTTQDAIIECLSEMESWPSTERPILEIETYAWDVLPGVACDESSLIDGIVQEINWCSENTVRVRQGEDT